MKIKVLCILLAGFLPLWAHADQGENSSNRSIAQSRALYERFQPKKVHFSGKDGLRVTADLYMPYGNQAPFIVLFHQAGWSRGEYRAIAPRLNKMGFNCLAVDQRSGGKVRQVINETFLRAMRAGKPTARLEALLDMQTAIYHVKKHFVRGKLILWGSSYSASLVLLLAGQQPGIAEAVLAFAPGEYFRNYGKPADFIQQAASRISRVPVFITSARYESKGWQAIFDAIPSPYKTRFVPETKGHHGSRALWPEFNDSEAYWGAVTSFLQSVRRY